MNADEALREMRRQSWIPALWLDTIEAELKVKVKIADRCPSCGAQSLFIGEGGWLTCSVIGCKQPCITAAVEAKDAEIARLKKRLTKYEGPEEPYE